MFVRRWAIDMMYIHVPTDRQPARHAYIHLEAYVHTHVYIDMTGFILRFL